MTHEQLHAFREDVLRIRRAFERAGEQLRAAESALDVAAGRLELLTAAIERVNHEQRPPSA